MTKTDLSPLGPESERGFSDGEGRPILTSIDHPSPSELDKAIKVRDGLRQKRDNAATQLATLDEARIRRQNIGRIRIMNIQVNDVGTAPADTIHTVKAAISNGANHQE